MPLAVGVATAGPGDRPSTRLQVDEVTDGRDWTAFVDGQPDATLYHDWRWRTLLEREFSQETLYLAARQTDGLVGVLPLVSFRSRLFGRFLVSLPYVNYGGIVATGTEAAQALVVRATEEARRRRASYVELRHTRPVCDGLPVRTHKVTMRLRLAPDEDAAWRALDNKVRNQVRKAWKSALTTDTGGAELTTDFYDVFAANMRDLGVPVHSRRFFSDVLAQVPGARAHVVRHQGRAVAAGITLAHRGTVEVPWASSLGAYRRSCPNMLLYWTMLKAAIADGAAVFDFGRSTPHSGTYHFKKQWGAVPQPVAWQYVLGGRTVLPDLSTSNPTFAPAVAIWRHLPVAVTRLLGPVVVRRLP